MGGEAKIGIMLSSTEVRLLRRDGFLEAEDMLTANPDINVIYAAGDSQLQGGLAAAAPQGLDVAFFGWDDIPEPFIAPLEDGRIVGFLKQEPDVGGEMAVRFLVQHLDGEEVPARFTYNPAVVTSYNLDQFR
jgi:ribose transport system substrate-binding protein